MNGWPDWETLLKWFLGILTGAFTFGGIIHKAKSEIQQLKDGHEKMNLRISNIESTQARAVRPEDLALLREQIQLAATSQEKAFSRFEEHQKQQLELITKLVDVATRSKA